MLEKFEKVDDSTVRITQSVEVHKTIDELRDDLRVWEEQLEAVVANYDREVSRLQEGVSERQKRIAEADKLGVK